MRPLRIIAPADILVRTDDGWKKEALQQLFDDLGQMAEARQSVAELADELARSQLLGLGSGAGRSQCGEQSPSGYSADGVPRVTDASHNGRRGCTSLSGVGHGGAGTSSPHTARSCAISVRGFPEHVRVDPALSGSDVVPLPVVCMHALCVRIRHTTSPGEHNNNGSGCALSERIYRAVALPPAFADLATENCGDGGNVVVVDGLCGGSAQQERKENGHADLSSSEGLSADIESAQPGSVSSPACAGTAQQAQNGHADLPSSEGPTSADIIGSPSPVHVPAPHPTLWGEAESNITVTGRASESCAPLAEPNPNNNPAAQLQRVSAHQMPQNGHGQDAGAGPVGSPVSGEGEAVNGAAPPQQKAKKKFSGADNQRRFGSFAQWLADEFGHDFLTSVCSHFLCSTLCVFRVRCLWCSLTELLDFPYPCIRVCGTTLSFTLVWSRLSQFAHVHMLYLMFCFSIYA